MPPFFIPEEGDNMAVNDIKTSLIGEHLKNMSDAHGRYTELVKLANQQGLIDVSDSHMRQEAACCSYLEMDTDKDMEKYRLTKSVRCHDRMCPQDALIDARKLQLKVTTVVRAAGDDACMDQRTDLLGNSRKYRLIFLTLTVPNCAADQLKPMLQGMAKAWHRFVNDKTIKPAIRGAIKRIEVTYNADAGTMHPHYHVLLAVDPSYFAHHYIKHDDWLRMWRRAMRDETITQVHVEVVKARHTKRDGDDGDGWQKAAAEISKYVSKPEDYLTHGTQTFADFWHGLRRVRLTSFIGVFKTLAQAYDDGTLPPVPSDVEYVYHVVARKSDGEYAYVVTPIGDISEDTIAAVNSALTGANGGTIWIITGNKSEK